MAWFWRIFGGVLGSSAGPWGSALGYAIGSFIDDTSADEQADTVQDSSEEVKERYDAIREKFTYFYSIGCFLGHVARADGHCDISERKRIHKILDNLWQALGMQNEELAESFAYEEFRDSAIDCEAGVLELLQIGKEAPEVRAELMAMAWRVAAADGVIDETEVSLVTSIGEAMGMTKEELKEAATQYVRGPCDLSPHMIQESLSTLGLTTAVTAQQVKDAYRKLAHQYHPDKNIGVEPHVRELIQQKFATIHKAYVTASQWVCAERSLVALRSDGSLAGYLPNGVCMCFFCNQRNRLKENSKSLGARCGRCGSLLFFEKSDTLRFAVRWWREFVASSKVDRSTSGQLSTVCLNLGEECLKNERIDDALACLALAVKCAPQDPRACYMLGRAECATGNHWGAQGLLDRANQLQPGDASCLYWLGMAHLRTFSIEKAIQAIEECLSIEPGYQDAEYLLGECFGWLGRHDEASVHFESFLSGQPNHAKAHLLLGKSLYYTSLDGDSEEYDKAIALLNEARTLDVTLAEEVNRLLKDVYSSAGLDSRAKSDPGRAATFYSKLLELDPTSLEARLGLGQCYLSFGRIDTAMKMFDAALSYDGRNADAWYGLGECYRQCGRSTESVEALEQSLELGSLDKWNEAVVCSSLARIHFAEQRQDEALRFLRQASEAKPGEYTVRCEIADQYFSNELYQLALDEYYVAAQIDTRQIYPWVQRAVCLVNMERRTEAIEQFESARRIEPENVIINGCLGALYIEAGDTENGRALLNMAKQKAAGNSAALSVLGDVYFRAKCFDEAVRVYQDVFKAGDRSHDVRLKLGQALVAYGIENRTSSMIEQAIDHLKAAAANEETGSTARQILVSAYMSLGKQNEAEEEIRLLTSSQQELGIQPEPA